MVNSFLVHSLVNIGIILLWDLMKLVLCFSLKIKYYTFLIENKKVKNVQQNWFIIWVSQQSHKLWNSNQSETRLSITMLQICIMKAVDICTITHLVWVSLVDIMTAIKTEELLKIFHFIYPKEWIQRPFNSSSIFYILHRFLDTIEYSFMQYYLTLNYKSHTLQFVDIRNM